MNTRQLRPALELGLTLPEPVARLIEEVLRVERARDVVQAMRVEMGERPPAAAAIRGGADPVAAAEAELAWQRRDQVLTLATGAVLELYESVELRALPRALSEASEELFEQVARRIEALVEQAQPALKALAEYAPDYEHGHIAAHGTPAQIKAFQASRELQAGYATWRSLWAELWSEATSATPAARTAMGHLRRHNPLRAQPDLLRLAAAGPEALATALRTPTSITDGEIEAAAAERAARRAEVALPRNRRGVAS